eukprot:1213387-Amphidinium_carterae.1
MGPNVPPMPPVHVEMVSRRLELRIHARGANTGLRQYAKPRTPSIGARIMTWLMTSRRLRRQRWTSSSNHPLGGHTIPGPSQAE